MTQNTPEVFPDVVRFLLGEGELDRCWFGETQPVGAIGPYWWRKYLRDEFRKRTPTQSPKTMRSDDVQAIQRLIDAACFTNSETLTSIREKAEDALDRLTAQAALLDEMAEALECMTAVCDKMNYFGQFYLEAQDVLAKYKQGRE